MFQVDAAKHQPAEEIVWRHYERGLKVLRGFEVIAKAIVGQAQQHLQLWILALQACRVDKEIEELPGLAFGFIHLVHLLECELIPRVFEDDIHVLVRDLLGLFAESQLRQLFSALLFLGFGRGLFGVGRES